MKITKTSSRMQDGNWKRSMAAAMSCKRTIAQTSNRETVALKVEKPKHLKQRHDSVVLPKRMNQQDQELNQSRREGVKTTLQGKGKIQCCITI